MRLAPSEFIRRFLLHALPDGFHRIRHIGFLANGHRIAKLTLCRSLLGMTETPASTRAARPPSQKSPETLTVPEEAWSCPFCGGVVPVISFLPPGFTPCVDPD
ncbi:transposase [Mesorhizobium sp.]|uniref:transposase n=1 Tax=Mesorhizobium sp. TaxID=1871066 RepID=UPI00351A2832